MQFLTRDNILIFGDLSKFSYQIFLLAIAEWCWPQFHQYLFSNLNHSKISFIHHEHSDHIYDPTLCLCYTVGDDYSYINSSSY